jgi:hypothetical protein
MRLWTPAVQRVVEWHRQRSEGRAHGVIGASVNLAATPRRTPQITESLSDVGEQDPDSALEELAEPTRHPRRVGGQPDSPPLQTEREASAESVG